MCGTAAQHRETSTGAAMVFKSTNSSSGTAAHRDTCDTLWTSGEAETQTFTPTELTSAADIHRCRAMVLKKITPTKVLLPLEIHVTLCGLQATHKPTFLLPQSSHHRQTSTGAAKVFKITNSNKGTAGHRDRYDTLWASSDAQTHTLAFAELPHCSIAAR